jgi:hypothetical protein
MLSFAEMLGRLAITDPESYPPERLEQFATDAMALLSPPTPRSAAARECGESSIRVQ